MTRTCSTPGCSTLTFGEVCLGCLQREARVRHGESEREVETHSLDDACRDASH
jgi:hypothetical protein